MEFIDRYIDLAEFTLPSKVLVLYGPRQSGKTTLLQQLMSKTRFKYKSVTGESMETQEILGSNNLKNLEEFVEGYELLIVDEAQEVKNIGRSLKLLVDTHKELRIVVTGSSSLNLAHEVGEPLVGRSTVKTLFPVSQFELNNVFTKYELKQNLEEILRFGSYPEVITASTPHEKQEVVSHIADSYLYKDILSLENIKNPLKLKQLLVLIAFQVGNEVSHSELSRKLSIDVKTVGRYLDLLEKTFILKSLPGFSRNLRQEVNRKNKYYFYDTGIRNAVIANFNPRELRNDLGALWENFVVLERMKLLNYTNIRANHYFWRTYDQKELDLIEEREGTYYCFEMNYGKAKAKKPKLFFETYPNSEFHVISRENYLDWLL